MVGFQFVVAAETQPEQRGAALGGEIDDVRMTLRITSGNVSPVLSNVIVKDAIPDNRPPVARCETRRQPQVTGARETAS